MLFELVFLPPSPPSFPFFLWHSFLSLSLHIYFILFPLADFPSTLPPSSRCYSGVTDAPQFFLSVFAETLRRRPRTKPPYLLRDYAPSLAFPPRVAVSPPFIESCRRFYLLLLLFLSLPLSLFPSLVPRPDALNIFLQPTYIKFLRFFELYLSRFAFFPSTISLAPASCLFPSLATRDGARDPGDNPVYLSDKRPINLFALSPTPLPPNPRPPRAH